MAKIIKFFIIIFLFSSTALAAEKTYIIGVVDAIRYPYASVENGEYFGKFREILDKFAESQGIKFEYKPYKIEKLYQALYSNKIDFKFPDNPVWRSPEKTNYNITYSDFITYYIDGIFIKKSELNKTFREYKIFGTANDILLWPISKELGKGKVKVIQTRSCAELLPLIKNNEIEGIFCNYDVMKYLLKNSALEEEIVYNPNLPFIDNYLYVSTINHPNIIEKLNVWVHKNRDYIEKEVHEN